jgi:hypothetical protein
MVRWPSIDRRRNRRPSTFTDECLIGWLNMPEQPTIRGGQWGERRVDSIEALAGEFGDPIWLPVPWPMSGCDPELLVMVPPEGTPESQRHYQLRSLDSHGQLLYVSGHKRQVRTNLESGLELVPGEAMETLSRPRDPPPHVVVRCPRWDVHIGGSVTLDQTFVAARSLAEIAPGQ